MLRALLGLLVLANLGFFAWSRGWLAPGIAPPNQGQHEPQRLQAQVKPELVAVLPPKDASAAVVAARAAAAVCVETGPLAESELVTAEAELVAAQAPAGSWTREPAPLPPLWLVYAGRWPEPAARRAREADLRKLGLEPEVLTAPADLAPGLVISRHASKADADAALEKLTSGTPPLRGSRVAQLPLPAASTVLRLARADADLQARLRLRPGEALGGGFRPCAGAPVVASASAPKP
jgi:hypothetical protein